MRPAINIKTFAPEHSSGTSGFSHNDISHHYDFTHGVTPVTITENKDAYCIMLRRPGLKKESFQTHVTGNIVTIQAQKARENHPAASEIEKYYTQSFCLPDNASKQRLKATYENGIVKLNVYKKKLRSKIV